MFNFKKNGQHSYSQCGEDVIVGFLMDILRISKPTYLDIGAHHPYYLSNTAFFYEKGCSGVCVEPNPILNKLLSRKRKRDKCLNVGVGFGGSESLDFYIMTAPSLSTFSEEQAKAYEGFGTYKIKEVMRVQVQGVNEIIAKYFEGAPNFVSLDVEGLDFEILKSLNFDAYRPEVFCIETLTYTEDNTEEKIVEIIEYMVSKNYKVYADTYINTIFVDENKWAART